MIDDYDALMARGRVLVLARLRWKIEKRRDDIAKLEKHLMRDPNDTDAVRRLARIRLQLSRLENELKGTENA